MKVARILGSVNWRCEDTSWDHYKKFEILHAFIVVLPKMLTAGMKIALLVHSELWLGSMNLGARISAFQVNIYPLCYSSNPTGKLVPQLGSSWTGGHSRMRWQQCEKLGGEGGRDLTVREVYLTSPCTRWSINVGYFIDFKENCIST